MIAIATSDGKVRFGSGSGYFCPNAEPEPRVRFKEFSNLKLNLAFGVQIQKDIPLKEVEALGMGPRQRACSGLGLDLAVDQKPKPADRLASPFVGLASPFARLAEKRAFSQSEWIHYIQTKFFKTFMPMPTPNTRFRESITKEDSNRSKVV
ncbi:hypothetical protein B0H14DRAFT_2637635 [Mycena olivaceomarginata]|nr:hypothetical protein B0H14DRAFT_2637635 [Mycena olivaceomarginata]